MVRYLRFNILVFMFLGAPSLHANPLLSPPGPLGKDPVANALGLGESAEAEGLCSEEDKQEFADALAKLMGCPCPGVKPAGLKAMDSFQKGCAKTKEALDASRKALGKSANVREGVATDTFDDSDTKKLSKSEKRIEDSIALFKESQTLFEEAKGHASDAEDRMKICPDPIGHLLDAPGQMHEVLDRVIEKVNGAISEAERALEAIKTATEASHSGFAAGEEPSGTEEPVDTDDNQDDSNTDPDADDTNADDTQDDNDSNADDTNTDANDETRDPSWGDENDNFNNSDDWDFTAPGSEDPVSDNQDGAWSYGGGS